MPRGKKKVVEEKVEEVKVEETKVEPKVIPEGWTASTSGKRRRQKILEDRKNAPEGTQNPVEESKPAPVRRKKKTEEKKEVEEKPKKVNKWRLHLSKTFKDNKGKSFTEVMGIAKASYKK